MRLRKFNEEVLYAGEPSVWLGKRDVESLRGKAARNARRRIRLCIHQDAADKLHEMLILMPKGAYVRPHKHLTRPESFHVVSGSAAVFLFDDRGGIIKKVMVGDYRSGRRFFYKLAEPRFHTVLVLSDYLVFQETKEGPFEREDTAFPDWAPEDADAAAGKAFVERLRRKV